MIKKNQKIISLFLVIFIFSNILFFIKPQKTEALFGAGDTVIEVGPSLVPNIVTGAATAASELYDLALKNKELILDGIAYQVARVAVQQMVSSTIEWINNGFQGNPAYITDFGGYMESVGDAVVGEYIYGSKLNFLCSPFSLDIKSALMIQYYRGKIYQPRCTLSEVTNNIEGAVDDLSNEWDWDVWNSMTQTSTNNPFGQFIDASVNMSNDINNRSNQELTKIGWGDGFLSWEECTEESFNFENSGNGEDVSYSGPATESGSMTRCEIKTPGSVLAGITNDTITIGGKALIQADEINEIVGALLSQLVQQIAGPNGLFGSSRGSGGQASYTNNLSSNQGNISNLIKNATDTINSVLQKENNYILPKQNSLNAAKESKLKLEELSGCYITKELLAYENTPSQRLWNNSGDYITFDIANNRANNATSTIYLIPQPIINRIDPQVFSSLNNINILNIAKSSLENISTINGLEIALQNFQKIQEDNLLHNFEDIANAQLETDDIISQMDALNQTTEEQITECESYILKSDPNNN